MAYDVKLLAGSAEGFAGINVKDAGTLYFVENGKGYDLYKGDKLVGGVDADGIAKLTARVAMNEANIGSTVALGTSLKAQIEAEVVRAKGVEKDNADHIGTMTELSEGLGTNLVAAINAVNGAIAAETTRAEEAEKANAAAIDAEVTRAKDVEATNAKAIADEATRAKDVEKANADAIADEAARAKGVEEGLDTRLVTAEDAIAILNGPKEAKGSVSNAVANGIAEVVAGAPDKFDTLKEVADWIGNDTTTAAQMQSDIAKLNGTDAVEGSVAHALKTAKGYADGLNTAMGTRVDALETAIGAGGSVDSQIDAKIAELDATVETAAIPVSGDGIHVKVTQENGKLVSVEAEVEVTNEVEAAKTAAIDAAAADATTKADNAEKNAKEAAAADATTKADNAEKAAKAYTDAALTWGTF